MDKKAFQEDLLSFTEGKKERRSNTALMADLMDDIEAALEKGFKRAAIYQALLKQGIELSFPGFETALRELRKKRRARTTQTRQLPQPTPTSFSQPKPDSIPSFAPNTTKPGPNLPGEKSALEKKQEAYKAYKESIKDLSQREQRKLLEEWRHQNQQF